MPESVTRRMIEAGRDHDGTMTDSGIEAGGHHAPGTEGVQAALSPLGRLAQAPVSEHVGVFEQVLAGLEAVLASVDDAGGRRPGPHDGRESDQ